MDPLSSEVGLRDLRKYFPSAVGLHYIQQEEDGSERLISVSQSFMIESDHNQNNYLGELQFSPPVLGSGQIYYVTEKVVEVRRKSWIPVIDMSFSPGTRQWTR